jgi:N-acetylmuramoyl-L-alanine amidase
MSEERRRRAGVAKDQEYVENVKVMKKILVLLLLALVSASPVYAEIPQISLRYSESSGLVRMVIEGSDQDFIKDARTYQSYSLLKIEFPNEFSFVPVKKSDRMDVSQRGKSLFINISGLKSIKMFTLANPPRLVIDAEVEKSGAKEERPVREERQEASGLSGTTLVIDPGHGGYDIGLLGSDYKEKDIALSLAYALRLAANQAGASVYLTRGSDKYESISERLAETYDKRPGIFVSLHLSSTPDFVIYYAKMDSLSDTETQYELKYQQYKYIKKSEEFARTIGESLKEKFGRNVSIMQMPLPILSAVGAPAVLIEMPDGKFFEYSDADRAALVNAALKGIIDYAKK